MAILDIRTYPDEILKTPTKQVGEIDDTIIKMIEDMADTMYKAPGVGLAAPQIGSDKRLIIYDITADDVVRNYSVLINPEIVESRGEIVSEGEGCLSVPELRTDVKRAEFVRVKGQDREGKPVDIEAEGILAIVLQHEIDHLDGTLFIDRISSLKRQLYIRKVKKMMKKNT